MKSGTDPHRLFVTGTDTNVGKTHVTCLIARQMIARGFRIAAYKPVCSGAITSPEGAVTFGPGSKPQWDDINRIKAVIGDEWPDEVVCPQRFLAPLAPPVAAKLEGRKVDFQGLIEGGCRFGELDLLLIEGAGGWLSPLTETQTVADLCCAFGVPVLVVARTGLGTINHTLLTVESIRKRRLTVAGIVLNEITSNLEDVSCQTNAEEVEARSGAPVFGTVSHGNILELHRCGQPVTIDWCNLAAR